MSLRTKNEHTFILEPLKGKSVKCVPGIGPVLAGRLRGKNILTALELFGMWLVVDMNFERFRDWFVGLEMEGNWTAAIRIIHEAFLEWSDNFMF